MKTDRREFLATAAAAAGSYVVSGVGRTVGAAAPADVASLTLKKAVDLIRSKGASPVELTQACLKRVDQYNSKLNAFITVIPEPALALAREMEAEQQRGKWRHPLHGVPIALKDNIDTAGVRTTGASATVQGPRSRPEDAEVARRLKNAGAILLGKLNLHEFAYGGSSTTTASTARCTIRGDSDHVTGGSSGGAGSRRRRRPLLRIARDRYRRLRPDAGGPLRHRRLEADLRPASARAASYVVSWTLDHVGPMCKSVEDVCADDEHHRRLRRSRSTTGGRAYRRLHQGAEVADLEAASWRAAHGRSSDNLDPDVDRAVAAARSVLRRLTAGMD